MLKHVVFNLMLDNKDFFSFACALRENDTQDKDTRRLLDGRLKPAVLVDIICSNEFKDYQLIPKKDELFNMYVDRGAIQ